MLLESMAYRSQAPAKLSFKFVLKIDILSPPSKKNCDRQTCTSEEYKNS